ncbi:uroporphyrinogen-III C-methyltransferase [Rheinheimera maricola]|uniref:Uroporphyrinogen-III C-methyltransferase n=1 Tax=Rheinheimera maricola TaxID=2793282 RepID=A0ABS7XDZ4_9GAMM|nr:uroporphyrinogen-III C-methyltransferase [Rheinheimera maricola]MBZ9613795.1 uroporphyrinogen-III C-methyltransferase [Rheinheimera maricola]
MSDTLERATEVEAPLQQLKQKIDAEPAPRSGSSVAGGLSLLLVITLGGGVAAAGYWLWPQWQSLQQQSSVLAQNQQRLSEQSQQLQDSSKQLQQQLTAEQQQLLSQLQQNLAQQQQQLTAQTQTQIQAVRQLVQERDSAPPQHWILAEVDYLLKLAAQKVWLEQDISTALALLHSADEKLAVLDDASLLLVRHAIAADQQQLQTVRITDFSKVHVQLQQLRQQAMQLPLKLQTAAKPVLAPDATLQNWRATLAYHWQNTWQGLLNPRAAMPEDYFDLTTEQQLMLRIALQQHLQLAQLAVMQQQPAVYVAALQQSSDQLQRYFNAADQAVQQFSSTLTQLAAVDVTPPALSALTSPAQLQQYQRQLAGDGL